ncbi:hypothetical protein ACFOLA_00735 [Salinicoccus hispanicus]|uniref:Uncharacterized protein n=1 Tax=Salinicoccus hispanicus TaxID=157225 RepID=A0A6N8TW12_9STAP|nr:hypothetical protein [Salinicoccus hispanicus]MXQ50108.1 hypothetical protein [Salinicoccus hispanicus]
MKKALIILSILNLIYYFLAGTLDNTEGMFFIALGTTSLLMILSIISLIFDENGTDRRTLSFIAIGINLIPLFVIGSMFVFL